MKDLSVEKIGKEWQNLSWANGWTSESVEQKIYDECIKRGYKFVETYHNPRGYTGYECEEAMVSFEVDSSD